MADTQGFEDFYRATVGRLLGQLFPVTGDLHEAEEVVQEAFARASVRWSRIRDYDVPEAWVRRVAMNLAADRHRRRHRQVAALHRAGPPPSVPPVSVEALALVHALGTLPIHRPGGRHPPRPAARRRIAGAVAAVLALVVAVGSGSLGRLAQPDLPATAPVNRLPPLPTLDLRSGSPAPPAEEKAAAALITQVRRCPDGLGEPAMLGYFHSAEPRRLVMIVGKAPAVGDTTLCWAAGVFDLEGGGWAVRPVKPAPTSIPLTVTVKGSAEYGAVYGQVDARAVRVRVRFRDRPSLMEVPAIQTGRQFQVNLYVGVFQAGWEPVELTAFDAEGHRLTGCALPSCPGN